MKKRLRMISLLLSIVLLLSALPVADATTSESNIISQSLSANRTYVIDFRKFVKEAAQQPWWNAMTQAGTDSRYICSTHWAGSYRETMLAGVQQAYILC